ncbi:MAG: arginase family protein [Acidimicrobiia bacterium]|nr:arginase family protein [Acidimicrobiia bacterium]
MGHRLSGLDVPEPHTLIDPTLPEGTEMERMAALYLAVADAVAADGEVPSVYAGDCCVILPVIAGLQRKGLDPVIFFFDAHGDFNTWETTPSQFIGGMPLAMATGRGEMTIADACDMEPLPDEDAILVDGRDLDPEEARALDDSGVAVVDVADIAARIPADRPLYVHVDVDVVDPADLPAINYPAPDGPSLDSVAAAVATLAATGQVVAYSASTWNPALPEAAIAAAATNRLSAPFLP